jgi:hypothetical protein
VFTILYCLAVGHSRFLANGSFRVVNHAAGWVNERVLLDVDDYGIRRLTINRQDDVHIATSRQTGRNANICLIQASEASLCTAVRHFGVCAPNGRRDVCQRCAVAEPGSEGKQEKLV